MGGTVPANPIFPIEQEFGRHIDPIEDSPTEDLEPLPEESTLEEQPDGSVVIDVSEDDEDLSDAEFLVNLAEHLDDSELNHIATDLLDLIEKDQEARKRRDEQYAEGIKRTGLGNEAPGGADFTGASTVVHPVLTEGCIDFAARAIKELFPASGPCKTQIIGEATEAKLEKAERKKTYMNWQLTRQIKEYRSEFEQMLTQLPLGGSQYMKIWYDSRFERPRVEFVPIDDIFLPFSVSDFYSSHRTTNRQRITRQTFEARVRSGLYRDIRTLSPSDLESNQSAASKATNKIEGVEIDAYNEDGLRTVFEIYVDYEVPDSLVDDGELAPYIITVDEASSKVLSIYRNWEESDDKIVKEKLDWIVEYKFIPWRGAYAIGLPHIIGSLSGALTGALRALMDAAHINNSQTMLKLKGNRTAGQTLDLAPVGITEIEGPTGGDDIRKLAMPMPFNPPSQVLFQLLGWLTDQAKGVVGTAEERIAEASNNMPMGTALALIEQGSITFSAIHARQHASQAKLLEILHRIDRDNIEDEETIEELGSLVVRSEDFQGPIDIVPVSDPNIFSESQRYAQLQAVLQLAEKFPQFYKADQLNKRALSLLNFPNSDEVLVDVNEPERLDAVDENVIAVEGKQPLKAYDDQDHLAHMKTHLHFAMSPIFCANPVMAMPTMPALLQHVCKEHLPMFYKQNVLAATGATAAVLNAQGIPSNEEDSALQLQGAAFADQRMAQELSDVMQMIQQVQALVQQFTPPPPQLPVDPNMQAQIAANERIAQADIVSKQQIKQAEIAQKANDAEMDRRAESIRAQLKNDVDAHAAQLALQAEAQKVAVDQQNELIKNHQDNETELRKQMMDIQAQQMGEVHSRVESVQAPVNQLMEQQAQLSEMVQSALDGLRQQQEQLMTIMMNRTAPPQIVRDDSGEIIGVMKGDTFMPAVRDQHGNIIGLGEDNGGSTE